MTAAVSHPEHDRLVRFGHGLLSAEESQVIEAHVATCDDCAARLTALDADSLAMLLRHGPELATCPTTTPLPAGAGGLTSSLHGLPAADSVGGVPEPLRDHPRYRVIRLLGRGGMGNVYLAEHRHMDRLVALKVIDPSILGNPEAVRRFRQEVKAVARLTHPNVVQAFDADEAGGLHFLVLEYVEGESLAAYAAKTGRLPYPEACAYARQAAVALQYAHDAGLVHRDVKPHNLMRTPDGVIKVLDFGLARVLARPGAMEGSATESGTLMGTPDYVAPEQARDAATADRRADVYSLGCTLYHLLSGRPPFPGGTAVEKVARHLTEDVPALDAAGLPPGLAEVVGRMTAREPEKRYQTAGEVAAALARFTQPATAEDGATITASPAPVARREGAAVVDAGAPTLPSGPRDRRRVPWRWAAVVLLVFGFAAAAAGVVVYRIKTDKGELIIETQDKHVEVLIKQNGEVVEVYDTKTKQKLILRSGAYELEIKGKPSGLKLALEKVTLKRGDKAIVKITREPEWVPKLTPLHVVRGAKGRDHLSISPNGRYFAVVRPIWEGITVYETSRGKKVFETKRGAMARFSPDSTQLITCEVWTDLNVYDLPSGKKVRSINAGEQMYYFWSPAGNRLLYQAPKGKRVWDWTTGKKLCDLTSNEDAYLTPDGRHVFQHSREKPHIRVLDATTGKETDAYPNLRDLPYEGLTSDGKRLLRQDGSMVRHHDVRTGKEVAAADVGMDRRVAYSGDHRRLLTYGKARDELRVLDVQTGQLLAVLQFPEAINPRGSTGGLSDDGRYAVVVGPADATYVFRLPDPPEAAKAEPAKAKEIFRQRWVADRGRGYPRGVCLSPDGSRLLSSHWGGVRVWDVKNNKLLHENLDGWFAQLTPDGKHYVVAGWDVYRLYETETGKLVRKFGPSTQGNVGFIVCPDGRTIWVVNAAMWDYLTGKEIKKGDDPEYDRRFWGDRAIPQFSRRTKLVVDYAPPGDREVMGRQLVDDNALAIYDVRSDKLVRKVPVGWSGPISEYFSASAYGLRFGRRMPVSLGDGTIYVVDLVSGKEVARFSAGNFSPKRLAISADDRFVAACAANENSDVVVWRLPDPPAAKEKR